MQNKYGYLKYPLSLLIVRRDEKSVSHPLQVFKQYRITSYNPFQGNIAKLSQLYDKAPPNS